MAYYGILMKDGTELTHYGVKGMKWGKRLFGKVQGLLGKPNTRYGSGMTNQGAFDRQQELRRGQASLWGGGKGTARGFWSSAALAKQQDRLYNLAGLRGRAATSPIYQDYYRRQANQQANEIKRNSRRINGR